MNSTFLLDVEGIVYKNGVLYRVPSNGREPVVYTPGSVETDPVFTASPAAAITTSNISNWNTAYGWGNHASAGYLTSIPTLNQVTAAGNTTTNAITVGSLVASSSATVGVANSTNGTLRVERSTGNTGFILQGSSGNIIGAGSAPVWQPYNYSDASNNFNIGHASIGSFNWYAGGSQTVTSNTHLMRLTRGGNLLIGTTTDSGFKLDVQGTIRSTGVITASGGTSTDWNTAFGWGNHALVGYLTSYTETDTLNSVLTRGNTSNISILFSGSTEAIRPTTDSTGSLGSGSYRFSQLHVRNVNSGANTLDIFGADINLANNSGVTRVRIFGGSGNVVVQSGGTVTDAGYKLDVQGSIRTTSTINATLANTATAYIVNYNTTTGLFTYGDNFTTYGLGVSTLASSPSNDLNNVTTVGFVQSHTSTLNAPVGSFGMYLHLQHSTGNAFQLGSGRGTTDPLYIRKQANSVWTSWVKVWDENAFSQTTINTWNDAYNRWAGTLYTDFDLITQNEFLKGHTSTVNVPSGLTSFLSGISPMYSTGNGWMLVSTRASGNDLYYRKVSNGTWSAYYQLWSSRNFTSTDITNWGTAYTNRITSLTTTGSSGAATLSANVLNIPNYTLAGLGYTVPTLQQVTAAGNTTTNSVNIQNYLDLTNASGVTGTGLSLGYISGSYGFIQTFGSRHLVLNSVGNNVLIGTTTDAGYKLDVNGTTRLQSTLLVTGAVTLNSTLTVQGNTIANGDITTRKFVQATTGVPSDNLGNPTVTEMALFDEQFDNKLAFFNIANFTFETYDGTTWTDITSTLTDINKKKLVGGDATDGGFVIPYGTVQYRITINNGGYVFLNALYSYWSGSGHSTQVHIWKKHNSGSWEQHTNSTTTITSWPGHMYLPFNTIAWHPAGTLGTHYNQVRIVYTPTWNTGLPGNNISIYKLQLWGGYPANKRVIYTTNEDRRVTFPAEVIVTGNLSTSAQFNVTGSSGFSGSASFSGGQFVSTTTGSNTRTVYRVNNADIATIGSDAAVYGVNASYFDIYVNGNNDLQLSTNNIRRLIVKGNGNVLIGPTTDAGYKLDVDGPGRYGNALTINTPVFGSTQNTGSLLVTAASGDTRNFSVFLGSTGVYNAVSNTNTVAASLAGIRFDWYTENWMISATRGGGADIKGLVFSRNGTEHMVINSDGSVGLGTTTPTYRLDVNGTGRINGVTINNSGAKRILGTHSIGGMMVLCGGTSEADGATINIAGDSYGSGDYIEMYSARVYMTANVGIGTVSPSARLHVLGDQTTVSLNSTTPTGVAFIASNSDSLYGTMIGSYSTGAGALQQRRTNAATYYNFYLQPHGGNVGIGNTSPTEKLHVSGNIALSGNLIPTGGGQSLGTFANRFGDLWAGGLIVGTTFYGDNLQSASGNIYFKEGGGVERMRMTSVGNFLIGTTTDAGEKLQVIGDIRSTGIIKSMYQAGDEGGEIILNKPVSGTTIDTSVTIDVYQDKVRIYETGGLNRGGFFDLSTLAPGVGTNFIPNGYTGTLTIASNPPGQQNIQIDKGLITNVF